MKRSLSALIVCCYLLFVHIQFVSSESNWNELKESECQKLCDTLTDYMNSYIGFLNDFPQAFKDAFSNTLHAEKLIVYYDRTKDTFYGYTNSQSMQMDLGYYYTEVEGKFWESTKKSLSQYIRLLAFQCMSSEYFEHSNIVLAFIEDIEHKDTIYDTFDSYDLNIPFYESGNGIAYALEIKDCYESWDWQEDIWSINVYDYVTYDEHFIP